MAIHLRQINAGDGTKLTPGLFINARDTRNIVIGLLPLASLYVYRPATVKGFKHLYIYIYIYVYVYACMCVCVPVGVDRYDINRKSQLNHFLKFSKTKSSLGLYCLGDASLTKCRCDICCEALWCSVAHSLSDP